MNKRTTANELTTTHYLACNLCEAICGLEIKVQQQQIISIKGDKDDPFSKGHICPKAIVLQDIYNDPDRLRQPVKKTATGWQKIPWKQAFDEVAAKIKTIQLQAGKNAVAIYQGNPTVHNLDAMLFSPMFVRSLGTKNCYSATSVDQLPEQLVSLLMFGHSLMVPVPDLDRTKFLLIFGANPIVSNGSLMTAPGMKKRLKAIQDQGGRLVVIDPRKTETANMADQHYFIKPGSDALLLLAMLHVVFAENLDKLNSASDYVYGLAEIKELANNYSPEKVAAATAVDPVEVRKLVRQFCQAEAASCYGRIGVSTQEFGTLSQWLIIVFNIVTGNLDRPGGVMFSKPAVDIMRKPSGKRKGFADHFTRVRKLPNFSGEFPVVALAEEILTSGDGQIKALITSAGNPVLSTPNGNQLDKALNSLDYMVSIDFYINETTRHADIILPPLSALERDHYDLVFHHFAVHNTARYSEALFKPEKNQRSDATIFLELMWRMQSKDLWSKITGWLKKTLILAIGSKGIINSKLKQGYYGKSHKLSINKLRKNPHGIDLGGLEPCLPKRLFTSDKKMNLAPKLCLEDIERLNVFLEKTDKPKQDNNYDLLLIGRRDPRTNNSWLHNSKRMIKGKNRCLAMINPADAQQRNIAEADIVTVKSRVGEIKIAAMITDEIMPGVISIPHGWGHDMEGVNLKVAKSQPGVNTNILSDEHFLDGLSGNAALNGIPVSVS